MRAAAKAATERGEDPWSVFLAGWDAVLDTAIDEPLQRIRVVDAPAVLGWQRWQERNARYTLANIEAGLVRCGVFPGSGVRRRNIGHRQSVSGLGVELSGHRHDFGNESRGSCRYTLAIRRRSLVESASLAVPRSSRWVLSA